MKKLKTLAISALVALICTVGYSQYPENRFIEIFEESDNVFAEREAEISLVTSVTFEIEMLGLVVDYEEYCFMDSISVCWSYFSGRRYEDIFMEFRDYIPTGTPMEVWNHELSLQKRCGVVWLHRQPTFRGFSKWLSDKLN